MFVTLRQHIANAGFVSLDTHAVGYRIALPYGWVSSAAGFRRYFVFAAAAFCTRVAGRIFTRYICGNLVSWHRPPSFRVAKRGLGCRLDSVYGPFGFAAHILLFALALPPATPERSSRAYVGHVLSLRMRVLHREYCTPLHTAHASLRSLRTLPVFIMPRLTLFCRAFALSINASPRRFCRSPHRRLFPRA